eukprot:PhF_6_TR15548/c0_g1_i1/m.24167
MLSLISNGQTQKVLHDQPLPIPGESDVVVKVLCSSGFSRSHMDNDTKPTGTSWGIPGTVAVGRVTQHGRNVHPSFQSKMVLCFTYDSSRGTASEYCSTLAHMAFKLPANTTKEDYITLASRAEPLVASILICNNYLRVEDKEFVSLYGFDKDQPFKTVLINILQCNGSVCVPADVTTDLGFECSVVLCSSEPNLVSSLDSAVKSLCSGGRLCLVNFDNTTQEIPQPIISELSRKCCVLSFFTFANIFEASNRHDSIGCAVNRSLELFREDHLKLPKPKAQRIDVVGNGRLEPSDVILFE